MCNQNEEYHVYVMLSFTGTILSKMIRLVTKEPYSHSSFSIDKELKRMYSFGRLNAWNVLYAGHLHENINKDVFGRFKQTKCVIYEIDVTKEQYENVEKVVDDFYKERKKYHYNYPGLVMAVLGKYPEYKDCFYCSQYVGYVLEKAGVPYLNEEKSYLSVRPKDFRTSKRMHEIYRGKLHDYPDYYEKNFKTME